MDSNQEEILGVKKRSMKVSLKSRSLLFPRKGKDKQASKMNKREAGENQDSKSRR